VSVLVTAGQRESICPLPMTQSLVAYLEVQAPTWNSRCMAAPMKSGRKNSRCLASSLSGLAAVAIAA
jgi:hypothetical protein